MEFCIKTGTKDGFERKFAAGTSQKTPKAGLRPAFGRVSGMDAAIRNTRNAAGGGAGLAQPSCRKAFPL
jgi:hypothetical protein